MLPVLFLHRGRHAYLQKAIHQAKRMGNYVILIGDAQMDGVDEFHSIADYDSVLAEVTSFYVHLSTNPVAFEHLCLARWCILAAFLKTSRWDTVYYSDSDVYLYFRTDDVYPTYPAGHLLYTLMYDQPGVRWSASGCCSFWTRESSAAFDAFIRSTYTTNLPLLMQKATYHRETNLPGGVCDMTLLYLFAQTRPHTPLNRVHAGCAFDQNVRDNDNYYKDEYKKTQIQWRGGLPYLQNTRTGEWIRFYTLVEYAKMQ